MRVDGHTLRVSGKNIDLGEALRNQALERVGEAVGKYFSGGFSGHVVVEKEGLGFRTDCVIHLDSGAIMRVSGEANNAYASLDQAVERIAKQLRRDKRRRDMVTVSEPVIGGDAPDTDDDEPMNGTAGPPVVAERISMLPRIAIETAIAKMEAESRDNLVFRNGGTGRINVIHRRPDGAIGWLDIDPEKAQ
jgi:ribosomal subunit interface protein